MRRTAEDAWLLIPDQAKKMKPAFSSDEEYEQFRSDFAKSMRPELEKFEFKRMKSEEAARHHFVR